MEDFKTDLKLLLISIIIALGYGSIYFVFYHVFIWFGLVPFKIENYLIFLTPIVMGAYIGLTYNQDDIIKFKVLKEDFIRSNDFICQVLGKALDYPKFSDDQKNFPNASESDGVCVGDHVSESIAIEAAEEIYRLKDKCNTLEKILRSKE
jgi:hypothetical protein